jgi:hypothetical protein
MPQARRALIVLQQKQQQNPKPTLAFIMPFDQRHAEFLGVLRGMCPGVQI